jgi:hypothetical protein
MDASEALGNVTDLRPRTRRGLLLAGSGLRKLGGVPIDCRRSTATRLESSRITAQPEV